MVHVFPPIIPLPTIQAEYSSRGYGTVLDSGTTFSYFPRRVYKAFIQAVTEASLGAGLEKTTGPDSSVSRCSWMKREGQNASSGLKDKTAEWWRAN